jgi:hypothetical protein
MSGQSALAAIYDILTHDLAACLLVNISKDA